MRMDKEVFQSKAFASYAKENLVLFEADFPRRKQIDPGLKKTNEKLLEQFNVKAFPTILVLSPEGKKLEQILGYDGKGPTAFVERLQKLRKT